MFKDVKIEALMTGKIIEAKRVFYEDQPNRRVKADESIWKVSYIDVFADFIEH